MASNASEEPPLWLYFFSNSISAFCAKKRVSYLQLLPTSLHDQFPPHFAIEYASNMHWRALVTLGDSSLIGI
jgi:hypothetical protein